MDYIHYNDGKLWQAKTDLQGSKAPRDRLPRAHTLPHTSEIALHEAMREATEGTGDLPRMSLFLYASCCKPVKFPMHGELVAVFKERRNGACVPERITGCQERWHESKAASQPTDSSLGECGGDSLQGELIQPN
ncbi:hypothetical protein MHYP_G00034550 [Metynnis hypsauchen]